MRLLNPRVPNSLRLLLWYVFAVTLCVFPLYPDILHASSASGRTAYFDLEQTSTGVLNPEEPVELSVFMNGTPPGKGALVAIFEGKPFIRRLVPMLPTDNPKRFRSSVTVEPFFSGFTNSQEKALRISVTFARLQGMKLHRFLSHMVYVTFGLSEASTRLNTERFSQVPPPSRGRKATVLSTPVEPLSSEDSTVITEKNLIEEEAADSHVEETYLRQVSHLITRSWTGPANATRKKKGKGTVQVRFRLHPNGEAQLIQVEKTSGRKDVDEAGLQAIVNAHPFPPFPASLEHESIDMHVELSRTAKAKPRAVRPIFPRGGSSRSKTP